MQYQMTGAASPQIAPPPAAPSTPSYPVAKPPSSGRWWIGLVVLLVAGLIAAYLLRSRAQNETAARSAASQVRTASAGRGSIVRTLRLTGTTGAEKFVSLVTPQLRGSRNQGGRDNSSRNYSPGGNTNFTITSNSSRTGSGSTSSSSASSGSDSSAGGTVSSTAGASTSGGSAAFRSATSRINRPPSTTNRSSGSTTGQSSSSSTTPGNELGSTGSQLVGQGGGGGGGGQGGQGGQGGSSEFGLILQKVVDSGAKVRKGQVVAEFDRQYMLTRLDDYQASVAQTEAAVVKLRTELDVLKEVHQQKIASAKADLDKARLDLKTTPVLGAIEAERMKLALEEAEASYKQALAEVRHFDASQKAQMRVAELDLQQAKLEFRRAEANADRMLMKAAIDGLAVMQNTFRGGEFSPVQQGDQLWPGQPFMQIVDTSDMVVNATVNQVDVDKLRIGARATVRFDAFPGLELPARVHSIAAITKPGGQRAQYVKEIPVKLKLEAIDPRVIPDLSVSVDVVLAQEPDSTVVSLAAIHYDGDKPIVYVRSANGWEPRAVQLGLASNLQVAIRSGLQPGEEVALEKPEPEANKSS